MTQTETLVERLQAQATNRAYWKNADGAQLKSLEWKAATELTRLQAELDEAVGHLRHAATTLQEGVAYGAGARNCAPNFSYAVRSIYAFLTKHGEKP